MPKTTPQKTYTLNEALSMHANAYSTLRRTHWLNQAAGSSFIITFSYLFLSLLSHTNRMQSFETNRVRVLDISPEALAGEMFENSVIGSSLLVMCYLVINQIQFWYNYPKTKPQSASQAVKEAKVYSDAESKLNKWMYLKAGITFSSNALLSYRLYEEVYMNQEIRDLLALRLRHPAKLRNGIYYFEGNNEECRIHKRYVHFVQGLSDASIGTSPNDFYQYKCINTNKPVSGLDFRVGTQSLHFALERTIYDMLKIRSNFAFIFVNAATLIAFATSKWIRKYNADLLNIKHKKLNELLKIHRIQSIKSDQLIGYGFYNTPRNDKAISFMNVLHRYLPMISTPTTMAVDLNRLTLENIEAVRIAIDQLLVTPAVVFKKMDIVQSGQSFESLQSMVENNSKSKKKKVVAHIAESDVEPVVVASNAPLPNVVIQHENRIYAYPQINDAYPIFYVQYAGVPNSHVFAFFSTAMQAELGTQALESHERALSALPRKKGSSLAFVGGDKQLRQHNIIFKTKPNSENGVRRVGFRLFETRAADHTQIYIADALIEKSGNTERVTLL